ncbi:MULTISPECIES: hypothetical protein [unclassified Paenibacillus]|uniref:hypothetical protein n=1 Tax=unclassified Paenibacillus TaxID=185978 RepID=UPI00020D6F7C|nr:MULTISPECIES: hypothetical protein [unclassified Paenibacillus]EGL15223.1 hypothetical protein HMPREF9413_2936 [Paenibacillus sp. HGF7]EPD88882.1 hypothetical protein HMPREF1207_01833 [Paenibacillus sp. HGH0039]
MINKKSRKVVTVLSLVSLFCFTSLGPVSAESSQGASANLGKQEPISTVESYTIETYSDTLNAEGYFEKTGYEVVNAVTKIYVDEGRAIKSEVSSIEDFYDNQGNYIKTVIKNDKSANDFITGKAKINNQNFVASSPLNDQSQLANVIKNNDTFEKETLDSSKEQAILKKLETNVSKLPKVQDKEVQGINLEQLNTIKQKISELQASKVTPKVSTCPSNSGGVESCGAYDNLYRHNIINGDFTAQVLGHAGEDSKYTRLHGNVGNNTAKASRLATFKQQINTYERYIVDDLEASTFWEVVGWASALASYVLLVQGFLTGPVGWVAVVSSYANALLVFIGFTSTSYATVSRLQISKNAAAQLNNAKTTHYNMLNLGDANYGSDYVSGF